MTSMQQGCGKRMTPLLKRPPCTRAIRPGHRQGLAPVIAPHGGCRYGRFRRGGTRCVDCCPYIADAYGKSARSTAAELAMALEVLRALEKADQDNSNRPLNRRQSDLRHLPRPTCWSLTVRRLLRRLTRDVHEHAVDRYSKCKETGAALMAHINRTVGL